MKDDTEQLLDLVQTRLAVAQQDPAAAGKELAVLLSTGSLDPVHRQHLRIFDIAARALRTQYNIEPVLALLSPSCDAYVVSKLGPEAIPFVHRLRMCELACAEHRGEVPVAVDPWEGLQPSFVDFPEVHERMTWVLKTRLPAAKLHCLYVCGIDHFERCGLAFYHDVVAVARPPYSTSARSVPDRRIFIVERDTDAAGVSSTEIRKRIAANEPVADLTFDSVAAYLRDTLHWA